MSVGKRNELKLSGALRHSNSMVCDGERFQIEAPSKRAVGWRAW
jgi:hypothetical protein